MITDFVIIYRGSRRHACSRQVSAHWGVRHNTNPRWKAGHGNVAGHLVFGIQGHEASKKVSGDHPGREEGIDTGDEYYTYSLL